MNSAKTGFERRSLLKFSVAMSALMVAGLEPLLAQETPRRGGTLNVIQATEPPMISSAFTPSTYAALVSTKISEGLVSFDEDLNVKPALAVSWAASDEGKTYTFKLREGVKWHDGKDFTADDIVFSATNVWSKLHPRSGVTWKNFQKASASDPHTVVISFSEPVPFLLNMLGGWEAPALAKHVYDGTDIRANPANNAPIGTGPFVFKEWSRGQYIRLERNPNYWQAGLPYLDQVVIKLLPDAAARSAAFEAKEGHVGFFTPVPLADLKRLEALPHLASDTRGYKVFGQVHLSEVNLRNEYLKDKRVRQAIMHAVDRDLVLKSFFYGYGKVARSPFHSASPYFTTEGVKQYEFSIAKANALLDEAGYSRKGSAMRFKVSTELAPVVPEFVRFTEYLKQALARVGIDLVIRSADLATFFKWTYTDYNFNIAQNFLFMFADPSVGAQRLYYGPNIRPGVVFANAAGYQNPAMDKLWEANLTDADVARRKARFAEIQKELSEDVPVLYWFEMDPNTVYNKSVRNHAVGADGAYSNFATTWIAE